MGSTAPVSARDNYVDEIHAMSVKLWSRHTGISAIR